MRISPEGGRLSLAPWLSCGVRNPGGPTDGWDQRRPVIAWPLASVPDRQGCQRVKQSNYLLPPSPTNQCSLHVAVTVWLCSMTWTFLVCALQFPAVNHPQTLERRYLGIISGALLDLMKVRVRGQGSGTGEWREPVESSPETNQHTQTIDDIPRSI